MKFALNIKCNNAAFGDTDPDDDHASLECCMEVARILRAIADRIERQPVPGMCIDINGNVVGEYGFED